MVWVFSHKMKYFLTNCKPIIDWQCINMFLSLCQKPNGVFFGFNYRVFQNRWYRSRRIGRRKICCTTRSFPGPIKIAAKTFGLIVRRLKRTEIWEWFFKLRKKTTKKFWNNSYSRQQPFFKIRFWASNDYWNDFTQ